MRLIIIGGGGSAATLANIIKKQEPKTQIDIFTLRDDIGYPPCEIPFYLSGEIKLKNIFLHPKETLMAMFNIHFKTRVKEINTEKKYIVADKRYKYDKLVIATGARPFVPFNITNKTNVFSLSTDLSDAKKLNTAIGKAKSAIIVGAGPIGIEVAQALRKRGLKVTIIEFFNRVLPKMIDKDFSGFIEEALSRDKINILFQKKISEIRGNSKKEVIFNEGSIKADIVVLATGFRPSLDLAKNAGIKVNKGIVVNRFLETSAKEVYAIGDVMQGYDISFKNKFPIMVANNAIEGAMIASANILGKRVAYKGSALPFSMSISNNLIQTLGYNEDFLNANKIRYKKVFFEGMTRKAELGGGKVRIKLLADNRLNLIGAQIYSEDLSYQVLNKLIVLAKDKVPMNKAKLYETSYTPPIDMPLSAITSAIAMFR
jgi:NADH oxidase (H2O2-forming)